MGLPTVTVLTCNYNHGKFLYQCANSVLENTFKDIEYILVDDKSTDDSREIMMKLAEENSRVKVICNVKNMGIGKSKNVGFKQACGKYFMHIDADCFIDLDMIEKFVHVLDENPDVSLVYGQVVWYKMNGETKDIFKRPEYTPYNLCSIAGVFPAHSMYRRELYSSSPGFPEKGICHKISEDRYFWIQCLDKLRDNFKPIQLMDTKLYYRKNKNTITARFRTSENNRLIKEQLKKSFPELYKLYTTDNIGEVNEI